MAHIKLDVLAENGYAILGDGPAIPSEEWERLEYVDWKSGGDTNFAPLASAKGEMECAGFWDHGKPDKDGIWTSNREIAPTLCKYVEAVGARYGRVRVIKLNPSSESDALASSIRTTTIVSTRTARAGWSARGSSSTLPRDRSSSCAKFATTRRPRAAFRFTRAGSSSSTPSGCITSCTTRDRVRATP